MIYSEIRFNVAPNFVDNLWQLIECDNQFSDAHYSVGEIPQPATNCKQ